MSGLRILSIALIGKDNQPLCVRDYSTKRDPESELKWQMVAHCSLDYFEEKGGRRLSGHRTSFAAGAVR